MTNVISGNKTFLGANEKIVKPVLGQLCSWQDHLEDSPPSVSWLKSFDLFLEIIKNISIQRKLLSSLSVPLPSDSWNCPHVQQEPCLRWRWFCLISWFGPAFSIAFRFCLFSQKKISIFAKISPYLLPSDMINDNTHQLLPPTRTQNYNISQNHAATQIR